MIVFSVCGNSKWLGPEDFFLRPICFIMLQKRKVYIGSNLLKNVHSGSRSRIRITMSASVV